MIDEVRNQGLGPKLVGKQTIILFRVRTRRTGQHYNVPVLRYRTPFQYASQTPYMNDQCMYRLDPGIALGSTRVYRSLWRDLQTSSFYLPGATPLECPGFSSVPLRLTHHVLTHPHTEHSLSFIFGFCQTKYFNSVPLISTPTHLPTIKLVHK